MNEQWQELIADNVKELRADVKSIDSKVDKIDKSLAVHKVKSGFWGALGGILINIINIFR